jgi:hypothetical protein
MREGEKGNKTGFGQMMGGGRGDRVDTYNRIKEHR